MDEFWSHSWHGSTRAKVITAFFENNGRIAPLIATGCAAGAAGLFALGILPMSFQKHQASPPVPEYPFRSYWGKAVGFFVYCIVLLCWKPRKTVFLDALCINDDDDRWKCAALLSMPVFLKAADSLLVLWDETYTQRMWCCFEIASFLHAHPGKKASIRARPTLLGPCFISIPVSLSFVLLSMAFIPADRAQYGSHALAWSTMAALGCSDAKFAQCK
ncbi:unnamed protein product [Symbiodinium natans]|uniref:Uncharacterized protein n=1 Tax=Symbiodinium natans TaxID=878477 RepID=A0A812PXC8_9DINO|nr:unnamed protein product [Symbiodinium natans]